MQDRRQFIGNIIKAVAGFSILPSAVTYGRRWKKTQSLWVTNQEYIKAQYSVQFLLNQDGTITLGSRIIGGDFKEHPGELLRITKFKEEINKIESILYKADKAGKFSCVS